MKLREGRTQQIRKMFQAVGHPVSRLKRVAIGPISDPKLTPGVWRELTKSEVRMLATMQDAKPVKVKQRRKPAPKRPASHKKPAAAKRATATRATSRPTSRATSRATARPNTGSKKKASGKAPARRSKPHRASRS